jgi:hypothetical protein
MAGLAERYHDAKTLAIFLALGITCNVIMLKQSGVTLSCPRESTVA